MTTLTRSAFAPLSRFSLRTTARALVLAGIAPVAFAANWPGWRGPNGDGTTTTAQNLPVTWGAEENVKWKRELPAWSGSSPVIWGDRIFIISPAKEATAAEAPAANLVGSAAARGRGGRGGGNRPTTSGPGGQEILLLCLSRSTGEELWRKQFDQGNQIRQRHNSSSPSPVTDGKLVWVMSGNARIACFDFAGNEKWKFDVPAKFGKVGIQHGYGASPLLLDGKLIVPVLHGKTTDAPSYIFSLNAATGELLHRVERPTDALDESPDAYTTPTLLEFEGKKQIVINGGDVVTGHDANTLEEIWRAGGLNPRNATDFRIVPSPVVRGGMIFVPTRVRPLLALKPGGKGNITESHLAWKFDNTIGPDVPTPVSDGTRLYIVSDNGRFTCLDAKTGEIVYGPHETGIGTTSGSPILADGKIYVTSHTTETAVIKAGPDYELLAKNTLDSSWTLSTPAFVDNEIFVRTGTHLYCIAKK